MCTYTYRNTHEYISKTCKYRLPVSPNSINNNSENSAKLKEAIANVENLTPLKFKSIIKSHMIDMYSYYCNTPNCYNLLNLVLSIYSY